MGWFFFFFAAAHTPFFWGFSFASFPDHISGSGKGHKNKIKYKEGKKEIKFPCACTSTVHPRTESQKAFFNI